MQYWWFDGIGPQTLVGSDESILYGTGRLFVQGPSQVDWDKACEEHGGPEQLNERRRLEEGNVTILDIEEWGFYDHEDEVRPRFLSFRTLPNSATLQINALRSWLNVKGVRENAFKANLLKWNRYIVEGAKSRQNVSIPHFYPLTQG